MRYSRAASEGAGRSIPLRSIPRRRISRFAVTPRHRPRCAAALTLQRWGKLMKQLQHPLRAHRAAPLALAIAAGILAAPAYAQTDDTKLDRIEVTGSRIRRVDTETSQPVLT